MKKIKAKILEFSDMIHKDDMEYSIYTREEFIKELDRNVTSFLAAKSYLEAMSDKCDFLSEESGDSSYLSIKDDIRLYLYTIQEDILKEQKEKFWENKMEQISIGDIYYNTSTRIEVLVFIRLSAKVEKPSNAKDLKQTPPKDHPRAQNQASRLKVGFIS